MKCENCKANKYCFDSCKGVVECFVADDMVKMIDKVKADAIDEYKHNLKETFNNEFPINYHSTQPYFTLDNVRVLADAVAREMKEQK